jgi:thymidine kinase
LISDAVEVTSNLDFRRYVVDLLSQGERVEYLVCDEAQFYSVEQIDQLANIVDGLAIPVFAFGILTDFRTSLFPGSARLVELADRVNTLQVEALCWCGARATHNARTLDGLMITEGEQVAVGNTDASNEDSVAYEVLCRRHHMRRATAKSAMVDGLATAGK